MQLRIEIVFHITGFRSVDGVITTHATIFSGKPFRPSLFEDDVTRDHVLLAALLCAQTFTGGVTGTGVGATLGVVRGVTDLRAGEEEARER
jgi:hypothetical protein